MRRVVHTNVVLHCLSCSIYHYHFYTHVRMGRTLTLDLGWNLATLLMKIHIVVCVHSVQNILEG